MVIRPNMQFVGNPAAFSFKRAPDAAVFGAGMKLTF